MERRSKTDDDSNSEVRPRSSVAKNNTGRETFAAVLMPIGARKYEEQLGGAEQSHGGLLLRSYC